jgi:small subunit ribosomal protein S1
MDTLVGDIKNPPQNGEIVDGTVISIDNTGVYIDIPPFGTGIIYGREYINARDIIRRIAIGDAISAKVVEPENKQGYIELSLKEARQALMRHYPRRQAPSTHRRLGAWMPLQRRRKGH